MSTSADEGHSRTLLVVVTVLAILSSLYSLLIAGQILLGLLVVVFLFALYLLYRVLHLLDRFVDAHERIAAALESRAGVRNDDEYR